MENKLVIQLGKYKIIAEIEDRSGPEIPPELCVYLEDDNNIIVQDICVIRPHYEFKNKTKEFETDNEFVDCLVFGDSDDEDYTDKFVIGVYKESEGD